MLPDWSIAGIAVLLLGLIIYVFQAYIRGDIVTRKHYEDQVKITEQWQRAWEVSQQTQSNQAEQMKTMGTLTETLKHFLESLPEVDRDSA